MIAEGAQSEPGVRRSTGRASVLSATVGELRVALYGQKAWKNRAS